MGRTHYFCDYKTLRKTLLLIGNEKAKEMLVQHYSIDEVYNLMTNAIGSDDINFLDKLISLGVDIDNVPDVYSYLNYCIRHRKPQAAKKLIEAGIYIDERDIVYTAQCGTDDILEMMLKNGADINAMIYGKEVDGIKFDVLYYVEEKRHKHFIPLLEKYESHFNKENKIRFKKIRLDMVFVD